MSETLQAKRYFNLWAAVLEMAFQDLEGGRSRELRQWLGGQSYQRDFRQEERNFISAVLFFFEDSGLSHFEIACPERAAQARSRRRATAICRRRGFSPAEIMKRAAESEWEKAA